MRELHLEVNGSSRTVPDDGASLLDVLRDRLGVLSVKDGCSPQGQCGCCTVLVDGAPRVACVTPARRVEGRAITTLEGLDEGVLAAWTDAFCASGASQCGFCTPGIVLRLQGSASIGDQAVNQALLGHLCRCTGWQTIREAVARCRSGVPAPAERDLDRASARATLEGRAAQRVSTDVVRGHGGFAADAAPPDALVALSDGRGGFVVAETTAEARRLAARVQGRRTSVPADPPLAPPSGTWDLVLRTSWVEPAYLELDASWCDPGGEPASALANGGAFGAKQTSRVMAAARELADRHGRPVKVQLAREDVVRLGAKRPPIAAGVRRDGTGVINVVRTPQYRERVQAVAPGFEVVEHDVPGPPTSVELRGAGWVEAAVLLAALRGAAEDVRLPGCGRASARLVDGVIHVAVECGDPLDETVLRSYSIGAAHMAFSWVTSEALSVDAEGAVRDLTIRSFGIVRAVDMPPVQVTIEPSDGVPVNGSDSVFAAVAAATWLSRGLPERWPTLSS